MPTPRYLTTFASATAAVLLIGGCSDSSDGTPQPSPGDAEEVAEVLEEIADQDVDDADIDVVGGDDEYSAGWYNFIDRFGSCGTVEPYVADYVEDLVLEEDVQASEHGLGCWWEASDDIDSLDQIRSVTVYLEPGRGSVPTSDDLALVEQIPDERLDQLGGVAYTVGEATVAAVIVTTVVTAEVEISITGGQWGDYPDLDSDAAIEVALELLKRD